MNENWMLCIESWPLCTDIPFTMLGEKSTCSWTHNRFSVDAEILIGESMVLKLRVAEASTTRLQAEATGVPHPGGWLFSFHIPDTLPQTDEFDRSAVRVFVFKDSKIHTPFANSPAGLTYMPVLRHYLSHASSRRILEWGPGRSTLMMADSLPDAEIFSVEHDPRWHQRIVTLSERFPSVRAIHEPLTLRPAKSGKYVTAPLYWEHKFDLIFIDGRLRADCIAIARQVIKADGVVLVHDAHRTGYHQAFRFFSSAKVLNNTAVLRP